MMDTEYTAIEAYMTEKMQDSAHDKHHVYRVLNAALDIARYEDDKSTNTKDTDTDISTIDIDVLTAACLLHDIGREAQFANPTLCHAQVGSTMAYDFLISRNWTPTKAQHVKDCISTHRFRSNAPPTSIEAKILFDADKLEVTGLIGIARTLIYQGIVTHPLYIMDADNKIITHKAKGDGNSSFFTEYNFKLKNIYDTFYTTRAKAIAKKRQQAAVDFYDRLHDEITQNYGP